MGDRFEYRNVRVDGDYVGPPGAGPAPIIQAFSARIPADGLTAMVGASGSGKTTLLRLLNRLDDPDAGEVLFEGRDVRSYDVLDLRRRVQCVGQVPVTFPGTVGDNVGPQTAHLLARVGLDIALAGRDADRLSVGEDTPKLLARVGLDVALAGRDADRLSVGEAQRMCLARALARRPECLLLDEPTSALDTIAKAGIEALVRSLADDGLTVVMVTHDPSQAESADRLLRVGE